jgi:hypothetical protein
MQNGSSTTLIGWISGKTTFALRPSIGPNGGSVAMDSVQQPNSFLFYGTSDRYRTATDNGCNQRGLNTKRPTIVFLSDPTKPLRSYD